MCSSDLRLSPDQGGKGHLSRRETGTGGLYTEFCEHEGSGQVYFPDVASGDMDEARGWRNGWE